ncbi:MULTISPECIES: DUF6701 domain-containing protein [unclassified Colwellia]|uniref:DUF6701 domain-containing protein n=1 Tax=unclassified Colwellia TaxID=196834 RepID=UPI0015F3D486|nr:MULTISPECIES: DUF6701 domain-containing protein [unclassified Colwellia]MBA6380098.1 hypothetical protein [Colwellia sp. BRX10-7]MBA6387310.1 hypothetical protein [Colwellia sp. BRX10-2]MBA6402397.1 hypothetical protein [Colwellia sp. BRX10-5]MBA6406671.1 hypothetical protein [Colwellia sp. BRX10-1]
MKNVLILAILLLCFSLPSQAERVINSVLLNGTPTTIVSASETISVLLNVTTDGNGDNGRWRSTSYILNGTTTCNNDANIERAGTYNRGFDITAPSTAGSYTISFYAYRKDGCDTNKESDVFSITFGITVIGNEPDISVDDISIDAGDIATFTIELTSSYSEDITLDYATSNGAATSGTDYTSANGTVTIFEGDISSTVNIITSPLGSGDFTLTLSNASAGSITDATATGTIVKAASLILDYRFDDCSYTGADDEVFDQTGDYSGKTFGVSDPVDDAVINRSLDLTADGINDWVMVPSGSVNGLDDFSVSFWVNTTVDKAQQEVFHALGDNENDDELEVFLKDEYEVYIKVRDNSETLTSSIELTDGSWHHIALTRRGEDVCLFVDGNEQDCDDGVNSGVLSVTNSNAIVIGQEQDEFGGDFSVAQGFEGKLDEFQIYDAVLNSDRIANIYAKQKAGDNADGSTRDPVACGEIEVVAGRITLNNTADNPSFTHVCFDTPFSVAPVVFSLPTTASNSDRLALRISNVTESGFDIAQVESPEKANPSAPAGNIAQTVDFLAIVEGDYDLDGGAKMRVSTLDTKRFQGRYFSGSSWDTVDITDLGFSQPPSIIASIQTMNNEPNVNNPDGPFPISEPFLVTAIRSVTKTQFNMALDRAETNTGTIASNETIGYLAITQGVIGQLTDDIRYESFQTGNNIEGLNSCRIFNLIGSYSDNPLIIATQNTRNGGDGGWLKRCAISPVNVGFSIVEDSDRDTDTYHTNEQAGGLALVGTFKDFTNNCGDPIIDHYEIEHDGSGLTCEAESIIIKACADADCNTVNLDATDVELAINGMVNQTVTVVGRTGVSFDFTNPGAATLSLDQTYKCKNDASASCDVVFEDTGFRFFSDTEGTAIPEQLSAKPSNTGYKASTLKVQAVKKNPTTGACQAAFIDSNTIEMLATCVDPNECAGSQVTINNLSTDIPIKTLNNAASKTYTGVALNFSNEAVNSAEFIFTYPDAGKVQLHARYNIRDENGDPTGNYMLGSSSAFVVRPLGFYINVNGNPKAQSANQVNSAFKKAGDDFTTSLTAVQWQATDDSDGNGIPDTGADLSDNTTTVNFGNEATSENAIITDSLYLPTLGTEGVLTNVSFTDFSNGIATNGVNNNKSMTYDEVGIVKFAANLTNGTYLGAGDITGVAPYVGRFIPHHFELTTGLDGDLMSVCDINNPFPAMTFAYSGQMSRTSTSSISSKGSLQYQFAPELFITAKSSICPSGTCTTTSNYTGDFIKLLPSNVTYITPTEDADTLDLLGAKVKLTANLSEGVFLEESGGVITYAFNAEDNFVYLRDQNTEITPFPAKIELGIAAVSDTDSVVAIDSDGDTDNGRLWALNPEGKEIRFGRASLNNSFGPETSRIGQVLSVEYFDGTNFVLADTDTCIQYNSTNVSFGSLNDVGLDSADIPAVSGAFVDIDDLPNGVTRQIVLPAVASGNQGKVEVIYNIYPWLQYDWHWNGVEVKTLNENPSAIATFGVFRGNDRVILWREVIN